MKAIERFGPTLLIFVLLGTMPYWMPLVGGYTALGTRVLVMAIAAMAVNFLLGFTGVLSFGHAAYLGLGAYGAGMAIKYLEPSTLLGLAIGVVTGTLGAMVIGAMTVRLRGVYFAMVTIAFGQVFYFIAFRWVSLTGGDDGLTGWKRMPLDFGFAQIDIADDDKAFYYLLDVVYGSEGGLLEHFIGELDVEGILKREHDIDRRMRRQAELVEVGPFVHLAWIGRHTTMSS